ncbi:hypothetical protein HD597_004162 [Nonomuraea thailandensis]|uniref:Uncharacterized protein n=1 Tax=Nonomuraea thailandensis TaxID=1188745 RepID=A0A9X2K1C8_9ACTN|nr:hypothetical protein [Nonomuraea thailandensis]
MTIKRGKSHNPAAATQTERRFDLVDLDPFDYSTPAGINAFIEHLAGIEDQLRLLRGFDGMLTGGGMPEYLFRRTHGIVGLLRRLIEDGCAKAIATGEEQLTPELLAGTAIRLGNLADLDAGEIPSIPGRTRRVPAPLGLASAGHTAAAGQGHPVRRWSPRPAEPAALDRSQPPGLRDGHRSHRGRGR